jgi:hypothetical protein
MCIVPNGRVRSSIHLLMPSSSQCGGAARKPYIPVSSLTPRAEEPIDEPLAWPIGLSPLLTRPDLSRPSRLCLVSARLFSTLLDSSRLCSTLLDSARLWSTLVDSGRLWSTRPNSGYVSPASFMSRLCSTLCSLALTFLAHLGYVSTASTLLALCSTLLDSAQLQP